MVQQEGQQINTFRLPDADNRVVLLIDSPIRIISVSECTQLQGVQGIVALNSILSGNDI
jgi:hypothetical protein